MINDLKAIEEGHKKNLREVKSLPPIVKRMMLPHFGYREWGEVSDEELDKVLTWELERHLILYDGEWCPF